MKTEHYDIIIKGAGLAGLSLALSLAENGYKGRVLIVERAHSPNTSKTWCFWGRENVPPYLSPLINKSWQSWSVSCEETGEENTLFSSTDSYCCIMGASFYQYALSRLEKNKHFDFHWGATAQTVSNITEGVGVVIDKNLFTADYGFDNACHLTAAKADSINQYFVGAWISTSNLNISTDTVQLMKEMKADNQAFEFTYVLPFNEQEALVELTRFSMNDESLDTMKSMCEQEILRGSYGNNVNIRCWEQGVLPMDTRRKSVQSANWHNIGINANMIRASSGYAFIIIQRAVTEIAQALVHKRKVPASLGKHAIYTALDSIFLRVLRHNMSQSPAIFNAMLKQTNAHTFTRFMTERASILDILRVIKAMPTDLFVRACIPKMK
ncbi:lycopene cyclase family protein [Alteromonas sp. MTD1]|uniref:FAD-dependent oxidoreductase n=1 Tax=Alteromonas sp. MTD1 TaxID=3057962 RepID=UPI0036F240CC